MEESNTVISVIDVETTGKDTERDQVIEFAVQKGLEANSFNKSWRIKPDKKISKEAQEVHGISDSDLVQCAPFKDYASVIRQILDESAVIVGYNVVFDIKVLQAELRRIKEPEMNLAGKLIIDPLQMWRKCEPRKLEDAVKRFVGEEHLGAHSASADIAATGRVLLGMRKEFGLEGMSWEELDKFLNPEKEFWIGPTSHFQWTNGVPTIGFGKHRGMSISDLLKTNAGYLSWVMERDFPEHVKNIVKATRSKSPEDLVAWLQETYRP